MFIVNPDETQRRFLIEQLALDEHTLASALDQDEPARLEFEPQHCALIYKRPKRYMHIDNLLFKVGSVGIFLFGSKVIIVSAEDENVLEGIHTAKVNSHADLALKLMYRTIVHFRDHLKVISQISDSLQDKIKQSMENRHLLDLFTLQKSLVYYVDSISSNGALLEKMKLNAAKIGLNQDEMETLDDIMIENNQCYRQADIFSNILAGLMDARASIVSNNLNVLMKTLNIITIAIMVPTFVVSAFSMNVKIPLEEHEHAFLLIMGLAVLSVVAFLALWRYKRW